MTHWVKQRDKDIWDPLREELTEWDGRLNLHHVESHTDRKNNEDETPRKVTLLEEKISGQTNLRTGLHRKT
jgi:hypothetical protein